MDYILLCITILTLIVVIGILLILLGKKNNDINELRRDISESFRAANDENLKNINLSMKTLSDIMLDSQHQTNQIQDKRLYELNVQLLHSQKNLQHTVSSQLEEMRMTVDEKLQKTLEERLGQSFRLVSERLEQVHKGLGEMQVLANGVGDLKKVLSNVKTRGMLGELQLGSILEEILSPEQYSKNIITKKGSRDPVEFAVKLPGAGIKPVYLPIDAKFPMDAYASLLEAYESSDPLIVATAVAALERRLKQFAKDIHDKYIDPPNTTDFAILFLPTEGLYAEAVRKGLIETLQRDYKINIAGPTTMAALLNSLQMGFKTLAIQKRSGEVWNVLGAVKTEFNKFSDVLVAAQQRIEQANTELDKLIGVRTRQIQRRLHKITELPQSESESLLSASGFDDDE